MDFHRIISRRDLSDSAYVLRFERNNLNFLPGQHINVGLNGDENRPYSIYSGLYDDYLEILIKEVKNGNISHKLKLTQPDDFVSVDQPHGFFTVDAEINKKVPFWFIGTGTGISPFHSFIRSYPGLSYRIIHGIRYFSEAYDHDKYETGHYICCTSRDSDGDFNGRVTEYVKNADILKEAYFFLCGNYEMIDDVFNLLIDSGVHKLQIKSEGYF